MRILGIQARLKLLQDSDGKGGCNGKSGMKPKMDELEKELKEAADKVKATAPQSLAAGLPAGVRAKSNPAAAAQPPAPATQARELGEGVCVG